MYQRRQKCLGVSRLITTIVLLVYSLVGIVFSISVYKSYLKDPTRVKIHWLIELTILLGIAATWIIFILLAASIAIYKTLCKQRG